MHGFQNNICNLCGGIGLITETLGRRWRSRDAFEGVEATDADLYAQGTLQAVARERHDREVDNGE